MLNRSFAILLSELRDTGIATPLDEPFTLADIWEELAFIADEPLPAFVRDHLLAGTTRLPTSLAACATNADGASNRQATAVGELSVVQELQLALLGESRFNSLDGPHVVADLRAHPALWRAAAVAATNMDVLLRDLARGEHHADSLYLATSEECLPQLLERAKRWRADDIRRCRPDAAFGFGGWTREGVVLRLRWD